MLMILVAEAAVADPDDVADAGGYIDRLLHLVHTGTQERKYSKVSSGLLHTCP